LIREKYDSKKVKELDLKENKDILAYINEPLGKADAEIMLSMPVSTKNAKGKMNESEMPSSIINSKGKMNEIQAEMKAKSKEEETFEVTKEFTLKKKESYKGRIESNIHIPDKTLSENYRIVIKEVEGSMMDEEVSINARGLVNSKNTDGITYFGKDNTINDVVFNTNEISFADTKTYFSIIFNTNYNRYFIRNDSVEKDTDSSIYVKMKKFNVSDKTVFSIGDYQFILEITQNKNNIDSLKVEYGYSKGNRITKVFQKEKGKITIGRKRDCDIILDDPSYARIQTTIEYENKSWVIKEAEENQFGLWIYLEKKCQFELMNNMKFKLKDSVFGVEFMQLEKNILK